MSFTPIAILLSSARQWTELQASSWSDSHPHRFPRARGTFSAAIRHARNRRQHTLISFIWSPGNPLPAGTGGSENYTVGQVRELNRQGVPAQVVTIGLGVDDGRNEFTDVPFRSLRTLSEVGGLDGTIVFVNEPHTVATKHLSYLILHNPPPIRDGQKAFTVEGTRSRALIATSRYAAALWARYLDVGASTINVVYPFAEPCFAEQPRPAKR